MNVAQLRQAIRDEGFEDGFGAITVPDPNARPSDMYLLQPVGDGRWVVFYAERGNRNDPHYFGTEEEACDYMYGVMQRQRGPGQPLTGAEERRAAQGRAEMDQLRRQMWQERGVDPDTLRPTDD